MASVERVHKIFDEEVGQLEAQLREYQHTASNLRAPEHDPRMQRELKRLRARLPVYAHRSALLAEVERRDAVVVVGETGSGKSTQICAYLADSDMFPLRIAVTQPRKIAAIALAKRVADEWGCRVRVFVLLVVYAAR